MAKRTTSTKTETKETKETNEIQEENNAPSLFVIKS